MGLHDPGWETPGHLGVGEERVPYPGHERFRDGSGERKGPQWMWHTEFTL